MRVRFAPSPTGFLHLGGLRTALFNFLLAKHTEGTSILRIEDTDQSRNIVGATEKLIETMNWLGLTFDEGPGRSGLNGMEYIQSRRLDIYTKYARQLLDKNLAYKCYCPKSVVSHPKRYDKRCRQGANVDQSIPHVIRFKNLEEKTIQFRDVNYGVINSEPIDDVVLMKSDGFPTYHFANVIDDHEMRIDVVLRGQEWLPSTPIHASLYAAFDWEPPKFCHLPLLLNPDKSKLSKRQDAARVEWYRQNGFFPQALVNFAAFLGWTPSVHYGGREILNMKELVNAFNLYDLNKSDAIVDVQRLKWFNRKQLELTDDQILACKLSEYVNFSNKEHLERIVSLMKGRVSTMPELAESCKFFFHNPEPTPIQDRLAREFVDNLSKGLQELNAFDEDSIRIVLDGLKTNDRNQAKVNMLAARQAITGSTFGAPLTPILAIIGKAMAVQRLQSNLT